MLTAYVPILLTVAICLFARPIGEWLGVMDIPDQGRKTHDDPTPMVGGVAVIVPLLVWAAAAFALRPATPGAAFELVILLSAGGVAVVGFIDDQRMISPTGRLILLAIFASVALKIDPSLFVSRIHTATWGWLPVSPAVSALLVVMALTGFSSAVNMVDGVNGLVLSLVLLWSICLRIQGGSVDDAAELIAGSSLVALLFNARGRLFLGDCGAFALSFVIGLLAIKSHNEGRLPVETVLVWFLLPVVDCLRLIPLRLVSGRSPFRPDRLHLHHRLGERVGETTAIVIYVGVVGTASLAATLAPNIAVACLFVESVLYFGFVLADGVSPLSAARQIEGSLAPKVVQLSRKKRPRADHTP